MALNPKDYTQQAPIVTITQASRSVQYFTPNEMALWRCQTLYTKEPSTISWLNRISESDIFLDIGANVGMYTIYAAGLRGCKQVYAIEPESQNYSVLCKNIAINNLNNSVTPYCCALSNKEEISILNLSEFSWDGAGSCHSFGEEVGFDLAPRKAAFKQGSIGITLDRAVSEGGIPIPDFIKIDVDGFEHKVIEGARKTIQDQKVRSISIELNLNLAEHQAIVHHLEQLGFVYSTDQLHESIRKDGAFKGCSEVIFDRPNKALLLARATKHLSTLPKATQEEASDIDDYIRDGIKNACEKILHTNMTATSPFPFLIIDNIFSDDFYEYCAKQFPKPGDMRPLSETGRVSKGSYKERLVTLLNSEDDVNRLDPERRLFWRMFKKHLHSPDLINSLSEKFWPWCANRLAREADSNEGLSIEMDSLLINDQTEYEIGPHTDAPHRIFSLLFYFPDNFDYIKYGTRFYTPKSEGFSCKGGPHYQFEDFNELGAAEYIPNSLVAFVRTNASFHGVPRITEPGIDRKMIITNLRTKSLNGQ